MEKSYELHDVVEMKKKHPCGVNRWEIIRLGADIRIKCVGCGQLVLMPRREFERKMKKVLKKADEID
ncbi:DUF951 domain-containing protein [Marinilactibacillus psychrotolerans]|uniref:DUF951 domain-containing protein n=2 Tax=Marinilactibacillus psychrotolerans TaxID=191770 RepID=A0A511H0J2_9LACT|nr:DUF951 domain-containing protein [Marinilactibacillus psychrotolerans]TLQ06227.1 DUF951 domain-containing protein [Marinilactibacillus psychrotolerans]SDC77679.1 hypothetical protein SAMN04488013_10956 [Marinilactibacillus psychrotolerans]SJN25463.1 protein involved in chromosome partitioning [Marinilactibacillus psychrotolerans 42ea]GEL67047.1 hypothetical protein MPS01_12020 [Marinilactibacillus psychrotolerans]GEQ34062.1 hypothetical protein B795N_19440 [Marinilactibacillus psychrotolera